MLFKKTKLEGVWIIELEPNADTRGFFARTYDKKLFEEHGIARDWVEESESFSKHKGTVRGLHFQYPPHWEGKLMRISSGEAFLVWVDLRKNSLTFGQWDSLVLTPEKRSMIYTPRGFANGLCTLSDNCTLLYKIDNQYHPEKQDTVLWNDVDLGIEWPVKEAKELSERDTNAKSFKEFLSACGGLSGYE
ncbi:dTDP-4-dehydrorhamnose 3,5-epimerase [Candidatus Giovannonibacteria bacterium RIFCSPLOWO2_02_FULL_43_11b]|uniref:dTDP-4-dehydrorhamnose 3,5-epimerase n=1 Tax=Candidatus Giovannonibacteria bacterium RIFCSPHIGHO2_12_FULL_43_15 TaxID=1798341 RepID=A0A1F5WP47_9BACT|nr:MAG: dTDP-4-dehydrorhamnose 3,5-epimerase [Candidatus Giovannonibacteria bacterium RIFCSPHIGHO2_01_FULL_43_100]OGF66314.1 MAG: dTDP-4-dehydrorhamnose 3,5-epimerase [Candidatus Giovannonibacteria bacterium RIFCSPHIGHO2_02_FULL_43_32]OGF77384.1 MAG: dTDP-4-dehydrorhamnose 3,5-epimerase [Candidatus Giovannonibacteria bacterium RIFCSPHIGHO2_12_FULL_43_15]OGF79207.1 MAG: dTDP-4-dehydrorhamnose 3,5-epimerase [Candidatus Giovannonibacteria bacterium RIFCSPLOWO2_01_FULL_43_60]OGF90520.1 MAG: dTDP-4-